jgi:uncharacterized protein YigE (DUF2233 family)
MGRWFWVYSLVFVGLTAEYVKANPPAIVGISIQPMAIDGAQAFVLDLDRVELRTHLATSGGNRKSTAEVMGPATRAIVAVNGGFFDERARSLGMLVDRGTLLNPLRKADWGVFFVSKSSRRARLIHTRKWAARARSSLPEFAIQAGPRLVVEGRPLSFKPQRARRTALGIRPGGKEVILVVFSKPILTAELAQQMMVPLGCTYALNLDGGSSTQLWSSMHSVASVRGIPVTNVVTVHPRNPVDSLSNQ